MKKTAMVIVVMLSVTSLSVVFANEPNFRAPIKMSGVANSKYLIPEFADWDGDGDDDMLLGQYANNGSVELYTNSAGPGKTPVLSSSGLPPRFPGFASLAFGSLRAYKSHLRVLLLVLVKLRPAHELCLHRVHRPPRAHSRPRPLSSQRSLPRHAPRCPSGSPTEDPRQ